MWQTQSIWPVRTAHISVLRTVDIKRLVTLLNYSLRYINNFIYLSIYLLSHNPTQSCSDNIVNAHSLMASWRLNCAVVCYSVPHTLVNGRQTTVEAGRKCSPNAGGAYRFGHRQRHICCCNNEQRRRLIQILHYTILYSTKATLTTVQVQTQTRKAIMQHRHIHTDRHLHRYRDVQLMCAVYTVKRL